MADTQTRQAKPKESTNQKQDKAPDGDNSGINPLPGFDSVKALRQGALGFEHWVSTNQELTRFLSYRLRKNLSTIDAFAKCRTSQDFVSIMAKAASDTVHDYANEYDRVLAINFRATE